MQVLVDAHVGGQMTRYCIGMEEIVPMAFIGQMGLSRTEAVSDG